MGCNQGKCSGNEEEGPPQAADAYGDEDDEAADDYHVVSCWFVHSNDVADIMDTLLL